MKRGFATPNVWKNIPLVIVPSGWEDYLKALRDQQRRQKKT
jgi:hypothetical protein